MAELGREATLAERPIADIRTRASGKILPLPFAAEIAHEQSLAPARRNGGGGGCAVTARRWRGGLLQCIVANARTL